MSTSSPAIQDRIRPRVGAAHLAIIAAVFIVGLLTGLHVSGGSPRSATTRVSPVHQTVPVIGPQRHISDMIDLRSQLHGHRFPIPAGH